MSDIKFSICIPNYDYANYIGKTIQSVLDQDYTNFEIIVADNASTDDSVKVVESFGDDRIWLTQNPFNVGFAPNLDKATEKASGDYMLLLSSDDLMLPGALSTYARLIAENDGLNQNLVLCAAVNVIDSNDQYLYHRESLNPNIINGLKNEGSFFPIDVAVYDGQDLLKHALPTFSIVGRFVSTCYSRKLYKEVGAYNSIMSIMPDAHFSHKLMFTNPKVLVVNDALFGYRIHNHNNYSAIFKHVKLAYDAYLMTGLYSEEQLSFAGLDKKSFVQIFIEHWGITKVFQSILNGRISYSLKLWHLVWACYPTQYRKKILGWLFPLLLPLGVIGGQLIKVLRKGRRT